MAIAVRADHHKPSGRAQRHGPFLPGVCPMNRVRDCSGGSICEKSKPSGVAAALLPGGRLHLQHGPIDIVAEAFGDRDAVRASYARAAARFAGVLDELVAEHAALLVAGAPVQGGIARVMAQAVLPFRPRFITPMAAVAGAVADTVPGAMTGPGITRAYANNGGDIALWPGHGESLTCALAATGGQDRVTVRAGDGVRGIATSGWRGRSFSPGIADAVTVLAPAAAIADAAATMIANVVDLNHPGILRRPARDLKPDSDLGCRLVTVAVPKLGTVDRRAVPGAGLQAAEDCLARGSIAGAALFLQGKTVLTGAIRLAANEVP